MLRSIAVSCRVASAACGPVPAVAGTRMLSSSAVLWNKDASAKGAASTRGAASSSSKSSASSSASSSSSSSSPPTSSAPGKPLVRESSSSPEELNAMPLPYLSFALGLPSPPPSAPASWADKRARLISPEYRMAARKAIVKEATRGYFHDFHAIKSHGGKTWRAPPTLIKDERALWFPRIEGTRLSDKAKCSTVDLFHNKISIVALLGSKISEEHTKSFYAPSLATFANHPKFQLVQINLQSNPLKSYLVSLFTSSLRSQIDEKFHKTYLLSGQNIELDKDALGFHNKHVGYTYLIDHKGRIRWAGSAFAEEQEKTALKTCTGVLLDRVAEEVKKK